MIRKSIAVRRPASGCVLYSPSIQAGSLRIASIVILRHSLLRPEICTGRHANGISATKKSGYISPHTKECMHPIDVPRAGRGGGAGGPGGGGGGAARAGA